MIERMTRRISKRYVVVSLALVLALGAFMLAVYAPRFSSVANGYPYLETKLGYTPTDLLDMAEGYGETGHNLYIRTALSLDLLIPLLAGNFIASFALYLSRSRIGGASLRRPAFAVSVAVCLSDWIENLCMIGVLRAYPQQCMPLSIAARVMTTVKYVLMLLSALLIIRALRLKPVAAGKP